MKRLLIFMAFLPAMLGVASDIVTVSGESTYYDDGTKSKVECMRLASEQARIDALAKKFGTIVAQDILQADRIKGNREQNDFLALSSTEVRGEWVADDGEPEYEFSHDSKSNLIVHCKVKGKAKEISNESPAFEASVLRNGTDTRNADNLFRDGDDMYLHFRGSADGFLSVFLEDETGNVYLLLPYPRDSKTRVAVKRDQDYVFFSPDHEIKAGGNGSVVEELMLTAPDNAEYNRVYVVFSPESFSRPVMDTGSGLPMMKSGEFNKWLLKARRNDSKMGVKVMNIMISPR
ncbi:MAG: DUF4384 domain-containing protein [Bacteroides sp.]|nr:DUF4384 domain-containing protein [Bacteroides sp.]MBD5304939.1 DUF4384 domain-containing protein [Bacteroides sp.]